MKRYSVYFVPHLKNRKKITPIRAKLCRKYKNNENLQHPMHMTLTWGFPIKNYKAFEKELKQLCAEQKPRVLKAKPKTSKKISIFWSGIDFEKPSWLMSLQRQIKKIVNKHAKKIERHTFWPHISLVYSLERKPIDLGDLKLVKTPVTKVKFDRITICRQKREKKKYRIFKHIKLG